MKNLRDRISIILKKIISWKDEKLFKILIDNSKYLLSGSVITSLFGFARTALTTRTLGIELFGIFTVIIAYVEVMINATKFLPWQALIKFGSESFNNHEKQVFMGYVKQAMVFDGLSAILGFILTNLLIGVFSELFGMSSDLRGYIALYSLVAFLDFTGTPIGVLRLLNKFRYFMVQEFITATLGVVGAIIILLTSGGIYEFLLIMVISKLVGTLYIIIIMVFELRKEGLLAYLRSPIINWKPFGKFVLWNYATHIIAIPTKQLDVIIVSAVVTIEAAGIYKIIKQVAGMVGLLVNPIYYAIFPQFADLIAQDKQKSAFKFATKSGIASFILVGPIALVIGALSPWWLGAVFGEQFSAGWIPLILFLIVKVFEFAFNPIHPLFVALGYVDKESLFFLISSGIYLFSAWQLGIHFNLVGIVLAQGFGALFLVMSKVFYIRHKEYRPVSSHI